MAGEPDQPLDYSPSSGATDPEHAAQDASEEMAKGRHAYTPNATFIKEHLPARSSVPSLNALNRRTTSDGEHLEEHRRHQDRMNDVRAWGRRIGLTKAECQRAVHLIDSGGWLNSASIEATALAALTLAANEATGGADSKKSIRPNGPSTDNPDLVERYTQLREDLDVDPEDVRSVRQRLRERL